MPGSPELEFRKGPIFTNFLLADELNRTSSKTQSALLEAMAECTVSVDGRTYSLPSPFFVMATQNPMEFQGVYPLAESQLDRFMLHLTLSPPERGDEIGIYRASTSSAGEKTRTSTLHLASSSSGAQAPLLTMDQTNHHQTERREWFMSKRACLFYISDLVRATRSHTDISHGVSVRGGLQFVSAARALAFVRGRDFILPRDVKDLAVPVLAHRLCFVTGDPDQKLRHQIINEILEQVTAPK